MFERYEEKSYMKILKVESLDPYTLSDNTVSTSNLFPWQFLKIPSLKILQQRRQVNVWVEKVFRGKKYETPINIRASSYKADFRVLSKAEEAEYCKEQPREERIISPVMDLPPLLKEFVMKETGRDDIKMKVHHKQSKASLSTARLAEKGEKPNVFIAMGIGKPHPKSKSLYEGLEL